MEKASSLPFLWGAATSSHQVEGNNFYNDWWAWEKLGKTKDPSGTACDHYHRFREDFDLLAKLGHNAHRFSLEWSRFEPEENVWNEEAFRHYETVLRELHARNIEPIVTLHHFTNPIWFAKRGGWLRPDAPSYFERYVKKVVQVLKPYVRFWMTINEPTVLLYHGFLTGLWPPGEQSLSLAKIAFKNLLKGHGQAYFAIHDHYQNSKEKPQVSFAQNMSCLLPCQPSSMKDQLAVYLREWFANFLFIDAAISGFLFFPGIYCELLDFRNTLDYLALNYYSRDFVHFSGLFPARAAAGACQDIHHWNQWRERNSMGWEVFPEGLYLLLKKLKRYQLPVIISENGICTEDDTQRVRFIQDHLESVRRAQREGVDVRGYLYWSSLDNFEWDSGFGPRFGLIEVNRENQQRKIKDSAYVLSEICRKISSRE